MQNYKGKFIILYIIRCTVRLYVLQKGIKKRGTAMPRSNLEVLGKPEHKYGNSSPRHMRENHYANSCARFENFLGFQNYKISITLLIYFKKICVWIDFSLSKREYTKK